MKSFLLSPGCVDVMRHFFRSGLRPACPGTTRPTPKSPLKAGPAIRRKPRWSFWEHPIRWRVSPRNIHYLRKNSAVGNVDWNLVRQSVLQQKGKVYDRMDLDLKDGSKKTVFFDIGEFFGKL